MRPGLCGFPTAFRAPRLCLSWAPRADTAPVGNWRYNCCHFLFLLHSHPSPFLKKEEKQLVCFPAPGEPCAKRWASSGPVAEPLPPEPSGLLHVSAFSGPPGP